MQVTIVGGGLTGVLAAFEAHRLGARDITLFERFDTLGGDARPRISHGRELRDGCVYFGPPGDPLVSMLQAHGVAFDVFDNLYGAISPGPRGPMFVEGFAGPALPGPLEVSAPAGASLAERLAAYPPRIAEPLTAHVAWHLDMDPARLHGSAAIPLGINRVFPLGCDIDILARRKRESPLFDELLGAPSGLWGRTANRLASLPAGGFATLFDHCRAVLRELGVKIVAEMLLSPRQALADLAAGKVVVWAASPAPLFTPLGLATPWMSHKTFHSYVFSLDWDGPAPCYAHNFTARGAVFRAYAYRSNGELLVTAECVREAADVELREEVVGLLSGFTGTAPRLGEQLAVTVQPRWTYHSLEAAQGLTLLRHRLRASYGAAFVDGGWETCGKSDRFAQVNAGLAQALGEHAGLHAAAR